MYAVTIAREPLSVLGFGLGLFWLLEQLFEVLVPLEFLP